MWFYFRFSGKQSTLFVILFVSDLYSDGDFVRLIEECLKEKLSLIPHTKLLIIDAWSKMMEKDEIPPETLQVYLRRQNGLGALLEHLNKRYKSLDLIAVMMELKRTVLTPYYHLHTFNDYDDDDEWSFSRRERGNVEIYENLSCLPRLQKMEQML